MYSAGPPPWSSRAKSTRERDQEVLRQGLGLGVQQPHPGVYVPPGVLGRCRWIAAEGQRFDLPAAVGKLGAAVLLERRGVLEGEAQRARQLVSASPRPAALVEAPARDRSITQPALDAHRARPAFDRQPG